MSVKPLVLGDNIPMRGQEDPRSVQEDNEGSQRNLWSLIEKTHSLIA